MSTIQDIISNPALHDYLAILKGARNGFVYGMRIRFPHALIMAILFGRGDWQSRLHVIYRATKEHALILAKFVTIYKTLVLFQKKANGGKERNADTFLAGLIGSYFASGERTAVNEQIVLYVASRVIASFIPRASTPYSTGLNSRSAGSAVKHVPPDAHYFALFTALSWGAVMWLFAHRGETIQPGMFSAMKYLYRDSNHWKDLRTLLWHNE